MSDKDLVDYAAAVTAQRDALLSVCRQLARLKTGPTEARRSEWIERVLSLAELARAALESQP